MGEGRMKILALCVCVGGCECGEAPLVLSGIKAMSWDMFHSLTCSMPLFFVVAQQLPFCLEATGPTPFLASFSVQCQ